MLIILVFSFALTKQTFVQARNHNVLWTTIVCRVKLACRVYVATHVLSIILAERTPSVEPVLTGPCACVPKAGPGILKFDATNQSAPVTQNVLRTASVSTRSVWIRAVTEQFVLQLPAAERCHIEASAIVHQELKEILWRLALPSVANRMMTAPRMKLATLSIASVVKSVLQACALQKHTARERTTYQFARVALEPPEILT